MTESKSSMRNGSFDQSPIAASLTVGPQHDGAFPISLSLTTDRQMETAVAECSGTMFDSDLEDLCSGLERIAEPGGSSLSYSPMDPSFLLRAQVQPDGSVDLIWVVDQGMHEAQFSTDTGVGVLMNIDKDALLGFARDPRRAG